MKQTASLQAQESENCSVSLLLSLKLLHLGNFLEIGEPSSHNHESFDLFRFFALEARSCIKSKSIKGLPLKTQVNGIRAYLSIEVDLFLHASVEHDSPEGTEHQQVTNCKQRFGQVWPLFESSSLLYQVDALFVLVIDSFTP